MFESFNAFKKALHKSDKLKDEIHSHPDVKKAHDNLLRSYVGNDKEAQEEARKGYQAAFEAHPKHADYKAAVKDSLTKKH